MQTARLFMNGRSQAVRLPKECRFRGKDVFVHKLEVRRHAGCQGRPVGIALE